jgi:hypothetical protein
MVVGLETYSIGDQIEFQYDVPLRGLSAIVDFTDQITGATASRFFEKSSLIH